MKGLTWLASYPKSGNTWLRVFLANLRADSAEPVDIHSLNTVQFASRELLDRVIGWKTSDLPVADWERLRFSVQTWLAEHETDTPVKTHEAFLDPRTGRELFSRPATRCVLYVVRNPLDVAISLQHYWGGGSDAAIAFLNNPSASLTAARNEFQVEQWLGDWSSHVGSWVDAPDLPVCVVRYEDMLEKPVETFGRIARTVGLGDDSARVARAIAHSAFGRLQQQETVKGFVERTSKSRFFRVGRSGEGREKLTARQVAEILERHGKIMRRFGYTDEPGERPSF